MPDREIKEPTSVLRIRVPRVFLIVAVAAIPVWLVGVGLNLSGFLLSGIIIRWIALALLLPFAVRRRSFLVWTFLAMIAGTQLGVDAPHAAIQLHFLGELFLRLIRMIVAPLIFASLTTGIASHNHLRGVGRVALKSLVLFEVVTTLGLVLGVTAMNLSGAGWGVALPATTASAPAVQAPETWQQIVLNLVPENIAQAVAQNQILQVAIFSLFFGSALALLPPVKRAPLLSVLQSLADTIFQVTRIVMYLAPIAAGAALAYTIGELGISSLLPLGKLVATGYIALAVFCLVVLLPILLFFRIPIRRFAVAVAEPAAIGFATTTSEAALPLAMERMEEFGVPRWMVSLVIPAGYSFNMTGSSVYLAVAAVFTAQAGGIHLTVAQEITMLATLMLASKGIAGVPRAVLVVLMATASAIHIPTAPLLLILSVDALMDMGRTALNVVGNCMASAVIARSEGVVLHS